MVHSPLVPFQKIVAFFVFQMPVGGETHRSQDLKAAIEILHQGGERLDPVSAV